MAPSCSKTMPSVSIGRVRPNEHRSWIEREQLASMRWGVWLYSFTVRAVCMCVTAYHERVTMPMEAPMCNTCVSNSIENACVWKSKTVKNRALCAQKSPSATRAIPTSKKYPRATRAIPKKTAPTGALRARRRTPQKSEPPLAGPDRGWCREWLDRAELGNCTA